MSLSNTEFLFRSETMFKWLSYGLDLETSCELAGLEPTKVNERVQKGRKMYLNGDDIGNTIEYYQRFTQAKNSLRIYALDILIDIAEKKGNYQAANSLLKLCDTETNANDSGILPAIAEYLATGVTQQNA
jgi:hypothetical protein